MHVHVGDDSMSNDIKARIQNVFWVGEGEGELKNLVYKFC